jgi:hypothetical protein
MGGTRDHPDHHLRAERLSLGDPVTDKTVPAPLRLITGDGGSDYDDPVFRCTVGGWVWYCDEHDTHGNADTEDEAEYLADAHREFCADPYDLEGCEVTVWKPQVTVPEDAP